MFTAFRSLVLRSFTLYGVWWTELFAAPTGIVSADVDGTHELRFYTTLVKKSQQANGASELRRTPPTHSGE
jgi:hypothetical protein